MYIIMFAEDVMDGELQHLKNIQRLMADEQKPEEFAVTGAETEGRIMVPEGRQEKPRFTTFAQSRSGVVHAVGKVQDITGQTYADQTRNSGEDSLSLIETCLASWEYHFEANLLEFSDEFYAICGTSVAREGRFMAPNVYTREFVHPDDVWLVEALITRVCSFTECYFSGQFEHRIIRRDGVVRYVIVRATVVRDSTGKIIKWYGANQDITEQKAMEENLRISRERLSQAAELARLGPWEFHPEEYLFEFSDEFYAFYGTSVAREGRFMAPDMYAREFVHPDDAWIVEAAVKKGFASTGTYTKQFEHRIIRRDGVVRYIIVRATVVRDSTGKIIKWYGANQDITERKAMEENLRVSREKLSLAAELARLGPWEFNIEKSLFEFNDEFYAIYGTSMAREGRFMAVDVYVREFVHPDDVWILEAGRARTLTSGERYSSSQLQHRIIRRDGQVRTIIVRVSLVRDDAGKIIRWFGVNQDITEQTQAEQTLRESEKRLYATLNTLPDMLFRINVEGTLLDYRIPNQYTRYLVGTTDKYDTIKDVLPVQLTQLINEMVTPFVNTGEIRVKEYTGQVNGTECCLQIRTAAINEKEALIIIQDQTELYKSRREFQRLDKLDLIGKMAAGMGHEVRNPLTTVRGYLQLLSSKELFQAHAEMFSLMIDELDRSNAIITEFLALSRNKAVRLEPKNLNNIILAIYPLLAADALKENKTISLELDSNVTDVGLDESEIRQLIINFVRNGLEAMTNKGVLIIRTWHDNEHVMLAVRDSGSGIPAGVIEKIGTPFVTTKENGTGLGLPVCYSIAARHQAVIDFKTDNNGTEFTVRFNLLKQEEMQRVGS